MLAFLLLLMAQSPLRADPLSLRIYQFCNSKPACVSKQRQGVRQFLDIMTHKYVPRARVQQCLDKSTKKKITDWDKAAACMRRVTGGKG